MILRNIVNNFTQITNKQFEITIYCLIYILIIVIIKRYNIIIIITKKGFYYLN
jgi:hypothetical protein